jgi:hypothetical protein
VGAAAAVALDPGIATGFGSGLKAPVGITLDAAGNAYVADTGDDVVLRYDSSGAGLLSLELPVVRAMVVTEGQLPWQLFQLRRPSPSRPMAQSISLTLGTTLSAASIL